MEISEVRKSVQQTIERARRTAAERRERVDAATRDYDVFLERLAVPLFRQVGNVLRAEGYQFSVITPGSSVRLASDRSGESYIELSLDASGAGPVVLGHASRRRGSRVVESERPIAPDKPIAELTEDDVLRFVMSELGPFVER